MLAPARRYVFGPQCEACLRFFHSVEATQRHVRRTASCLIRLASLFPPLDTVDIWHVEREDRRRRRQVKHGAWQKLRTVLCPLPVYGPFLYTAAELEVYADELPIAVDARKFVPDPESLRELELYSKSTAREGPRQRTRSWWSTKPFRGLHGFT